MMKWLTKTCKLLIVNGLMGGGRNISTKKIIINELKIVILYDLLYTFLKINCELENIKKQLNN